MRINKLLIDTVINTDLNYLNDIKKHLNSLKKRENDFLSQENNEKEAYKITKSRLRSIIFLIRTLKKIEYNYVFFYVHLREIEDNSVLSRIETLVEELRLQITNLDNCEKLIKNNNRKDLSDERLIMEINELKKEFDKLSHTIFALIVRIQENIEKTLPNLTRHILRGSKKNDLNSGFRSDFAEKNGFVVDTNRGTIKCEIDVYKVKRSNSYVSYLIKTRKKKIIEFNYKIDYLKYKDAIKKCKNEGGRLITLGELMGLFNKLYNIAMEQDIDKIVYGHGGMLGRSAYGFGISNNFNHHLNLVAWMIGMEYTLNKVGNSERAEQFKAWGYYNVGIVHKVRRYYVNNGLCFALILGVREKSPAIEYKINEGKSLHTICVRNTF